MRKRKNDYLKYWRVIRYFFQKKYNLNQQDMEMLLFLYSEGYFNRKKFQEFDRLLSWDLRRFDRLKKEGWISMFKQHDYGSRCVYEISQKGKRAIDSLYKKLNGEEIPSTSDGNPLYYKNVSSTDKIYRDFIESMNKEIKKDRAIPRQQRPSPE